MNKYIPYGHQTINSEDISAVTQILSSDFITQGPKIKEFEDAMCEYTSAKYAVTVSSGTAALHIACLAAGIGKSDEVITSPITFVASANCVLYCGGKPIFADIRKDTINIDPDQIEKKVSKHTKAIIPVHFAGHPCELEDIKTIAKQNNLVIIEDAAHALGAEYKGSKIGSCKYSDMTILSFHPVKHITTGEGGMVLTNNKKYYERLLLLRNHGITKEKNKLINTDEGDWYYEMQELGFNYRITDFQAALGISQLKKLDYFVKRRRQIAGKYNQAFKKINFLTIPFEAKNVLSSFHLYVLLIDFNRIRIKKNDVVKRLRAKKIGVQVHYIPVYTQPYYQKKFGHTRGTCPVAEDYYQRTLSIPIYPGMNNYEVEYVIRNMINLADK